ncbi:hypothetical protein Q4E93_32840 [Flavitalea sp. BT771]|uniref:hypothetical protein n=1 Tax=Flavitalea sp. BT771 TaxID=3063329 RepID=UPI0026E38274|nr:hypothetical protein [Flavitalea sp. BT771]MDO6435447.1 hypothetical protein [Flavitalea sp. BT771]MDV6224193.1 hypothetical protein [Flavitalea sp. BT771]
MRKFQFCLFVLCIFLSETIIAQDKQPAALSETASIIPFQLTAYNNLSVQAILNKKDTIHLMFHTASGSVFLTEDAVKKIQTLHFDRTDTLKSWGGGGNARFSQHNFLQIGSLQWDDMDIWENKYSGQYTDGKFGTDLFANKVVEIDFDKQVLIVHTSLPHKIKKYEKLKMTFRNDCLFIESLCKTGDSTFANKFLIHSGYAGAVLLDDQFVHDHKIAEKLKIVGEREMKDSYGNIMKSQKAILPAFTIGQTTLSQVPVAFFSGALGRQKMSIIGGDILKRFNIIIDAQREYIYLKPNSLRKSDYTNV